MAGDEITLTVHGNLTADPELRFTPNGTAVANFTIASTPRSYDKQNQQWRDGETTFLKCTAWRTLAENIAESLSKGARVTATGQLLTETFQTREGENRRTMKLQVDELGASLRNATASITRSKRDNQGGGQGGNQQSGAAPSDPWAAATAGAPTQNSDDPWAAAGDSNPWA